MHGMDAHPTQFICIPSTIIAHVGTPTKDGIILHTIEIMSDPKFDAADTTAECGKAHTIVRHQTGECQSIIERERRPTMVSLAERGDCSIVVDFNLPLFLCHDANAHATSTSITYCWRTMEDQFVKGVGSACFFVWL